MGGYWNRCSLGGHIGRVQFPWGLLGVIIECNVNDI